MRTVTFQSVLFGIAYLLGLDPRQNLLPSQASALAEYLNTRLGDAWESFQWPELCPTEERAFRPVFSLAATYETGTEVYDQDADRYFRALVTATGCPTDDDAYWETADDLSRYIAYEQEGEYPIGEAFEVYAADPDLTLYPPTLPFRLTDKGLQLHPGAPNVVWLEYRIRPSLFSAEVVSTSGSYPLSAVLYNPEDGECYQARIASASGADLDQPAKWAKQPFPYILANAVKIGAYSDALREDGQLDKAAIEENRATNILEGEMEKIVSQQAQTKGFTLRTA